MSFNPDFAQQGQPTPEQAGGFAPQPDLSQGMDTSAPGFPTGPGGPAGAPQEGQQDGSNKTTLW